MGFFSAPGPLELIVILVVALIVLGPKRLPDAARSVGRGMREFRESLSGYEDPYDADELESDDPDDEDGDDEDELPPEEALSHDAEPVAEDTAEEPEPEPGARAARLLSDPPYQKEAESSSRSSSSIGFV